METDFRSGWVRMVGDQLEADGYIVADIRPDLPPSIRQRLDNLFKRIERMGGD